MISGSGKTVPVCVFSPLIRNLLSGLVCTHPGFSLYPNLPPDLPFHLECVCVCVCVCICVCAYYEVWEIPAFWIIVQCLASLCRSFKMEYFLTLTSGLTHVVSVEFPISP